MTNLFKMEVGAFNAFVGKLAEAGMTAELAEALRSDPLRLTRLVEACLEPEANPFELTVEEQLKRLRAASVAGGWGIGEEVFDRLAKTAPAWPKGFDAFRGIRVRLGTGRDGVIQTFEAHASEIKRVFGEDEKGQPLFWRWELLLSGTHPYKGEDVERLRLLNGNESHKPCVEWFTTDLSQNRKRENITAVRGSKSLSDDGLTLAWMFQERVKAIDFQQYAAWFLAGYELNVPEFDGEDWQHVPIVGFSRDIGQVELGGNWHGNGNSVSSVPVSRE